MLTGKKGLIFGVANQRSIAWAVAQALHEAGMTLSFTYQGERLKRRVEQLVEPWGDVLLMDCDVTNDQQVAEVFKTYKERHGTLDVLVHSIAFAKRENLTGRFIDTDREGFLLAMNISAYSLVHLAREAAPLMPEGGSIITMTYLGSERVVRNYNVMGVAKATLEANVRYLAYDLGEAGIRVNAISAGPIKTLAASGIGGFSKIIEVYRERAPMRRAVTVDEVAQTALYLASPMSTGVTGEIIHVDGGFHAVAT